MTLRPKKEIFKIWVLRKRKLGRRVECSLDGHVFMSKKEADEWMAQPWDPAQAGYLIEEREGVQRTCSCGNHSCIRVLPQRKINA